ncbi:MAG: hypothetical protein ACRCUC_13050 [Aestuariivirga sp.]
MTDRIAHAALQLTRDPAFREIVKEMGERLTKEVMSASTQSDRSAAALLEYHALQRLVGNIGQIAQSALQKERKANGS